MCPSCVKPGDWQTEQQHPPVEKLWNDKQTDLPDCTQRRSPPLWLWCCLPQPPRHCPFSVQSARGYLCKAPSQSLIKTNKNILQHMPMCLKLKLYPRSQPVWVLVAAWGWCIHVYIIFCMKYILTLLFWMYLMVTCKVQTKTTLK